jgi:CheY-like chemotaxis protein
MKLRVLLVEDNAMNSELTRDLLTIRGHEVDLAPSSAALRALLSAGIAPDIVLMDILLPDGNGVQLLDELRSIERLARVPILALTAQVLSGDEERMLTAGFSAVISKPINTRTFVAEVERWAGTASP